MRALPIARARDHRGRRPPAQSRQTPRIQRGTDSIHRAARPRGHLRSGIMRKILVVYYSSYGHIEEMAYAQAEGAAKVPDTEVIVKQVAELTPPEVARAAGFRMDQRAPLAEPDELEQYDAIIFGTPTRFGNMAAQMRNFLDQTGALWMRGALVGQDRQRLLQHREPARRAGDDDHVLSHHAPASRHDHRRAAVHLQRTLDDAGSHRRDALRCELRHGRRRRIAHAFAARARDVPLPGPACRRHHPKAGSRGLISAAFPRLLLQRRRRSRESCGLRPAYRRSSSRPARCPARDTEPKARSHRTGSRAKHCAASAR